MTTSTPTDAPRGTEFLYSRNRLNVETSRAQCLTVLVVSPALVRRPMQDAAANGFGECVLPVSRDGWLRVFPDLRLLTGLLHTSGTRAIRVGVGLQPAF